MQTDIEKDKTARLSTESHYRLKLMSLNTDKSVRELVNQAVDLLILQDPTLTQARTLNNG
ncbi:MAG TPA: hypothetical protein VGM08_00115 [Candidatus Saccharimonadales bacterium]